MNVWDEYWSHDHKIDLDKIARNDKYYSLLKRLVDQNIEPGIKILEAGCGTGSRSLTFIREYSFKEPQLLLLDKSDIALKVAGRTADSYNITDVDFKRGDLSELPLEDNSFDVVWNEGVNEHFQLPLRQTVFNEMYRVCKYGGQIIVIVPNSWYLPYRIKKYLQLKSGKWKFGYEEPFSFNELKKRITGNSGQISKSGGDQIFKGLVYFIEFIIDDYFPGIKKNSIIWMSFSKALLIVSGLLDRILLPVIGKYAAQNIGISVIKR